MKLRTLGVLLIIVVAIISVSYFAVANTFVSSDSATYESPVNVTVTGNQIYVPAGSVVHVWVKLYATQDVSGTITVQIMKDLILQEPDAKYMLLASEVTMKQGETKDIYLGGFPATDITCYGACFPGSFREYYVIVYWNGQEIYKGTDPDGREWVRTYSK